MGKQAKKQSERTMRRMNERKLEKLEKEMEKINLEEKEMSEYPFIVLDMYFSGNQVGDVKIPESFRSLIKALNPELAKKREMILRSQDDKGWFMEMVSSYNHTYVFNEDRKVHENTLVKYLKSRQWYTRKIFPMTLTPKIEDTIWHCHETAQNLTTIDLSPQHRDQMIALCKEFANRKPCFLRVLYDFQPCITSDTPNTQKVSVFQSMKEEVVEKLEDGRMKTVDGNIVECTSYPFFHIDDEKFLDEDFEYEIPREFREFLGKRIPYIKGEIALQTKDEKLIFHNLIIYYNYHMICDSDYETFVLYSCQFALRFAGKSSEDEAEVKKIMKRIISLSKMMIFICQLFEDFTHEDAQMLVKLVEANMNGEPSQRFLYTEKV